MTLTYSRTSQVKQAALARLWQTASISLLILHVEGVIQAAASCFPERFFLILLITIATATTHSVEVHCEACWRQIRIWEMCFLPLLVPFCSFSQPWQHRVVCASLLWPETQAEAAELTLDHQKKFSPSLQQLEMAQIHPVWDHKPYLAPC